MRTLSKVVCIFDRHDIKEWELSPLRDLSNSSHKSGRGDLLLERRWLLQSVWKASRARASVPRHDRALRAGNTALGIGPEIPTPNPTADSRGQLTHRKTPTSSQHIHGILWSPQVAYTRKCKAFVMLIALVITCPICILDTHPVTVLLAQVFRPLWPFFAASGITYFLVSKAQDVAVRCKLFHPSETHPKTQPADTRSFSPTL
jgi:F-type H+-transporting ATPase subunit j